MVSYRMLINGQLVDSPQTLDVLNPATEAVLATVPDCSMDQLDAAVAAARRAQPAWAAQGIEARRLLLREMIRRIEPRVAQLSELLTQEQGKPLTMAAGELKSMLRFMKGLSEQTLPESVNEDSAVRRSVTRRIPLGVVAALSPWNFPALLSWWKVVPALLTGNTVVLKPSPMTPLTVLSIAEWMVDLFPAGVLNVIVGGDALGPRLTAHPGIDKVSFTGSTETGRRVMAAGASTLKRLTLELGGNDAAIVLPDVDLAKAVPQLFWSAFANSGQVCVATKRLYVHRDIYQAFAQAFVAYAAKIKVGPGLDASTQLGPVQNKPQYLRVRALIEHSRQAGHPILFEGDIPEGPGYFVPVTVFDNPPDDSRVVAEEAFGPVLPLLSFDTVDEVIRRANASSYGLAGSVWTRNLNEAIDIAQRLETGNVYINESFYLSPNAPFAGHKQSGFGVEMGEDGLLSFTQPQTLMIRQDLF